jgi:hypothetical protein
MSLVFRRVAGSFHVAIESFEDLAAAVEMPEAHWIAMAAPIDGLACDPAFLRHLDRERRGRVRASDLKAAVAWTRARLADARGCVPGADRLVLTHISAQAAPLRDAATAILAGLGAPSEAIDLATLRASKAALLRTSQNGDGVVPLCALDEDPGLASLVPSIWTVVPPVTDACGEPGVNAASIEAFRAARAEALAYLSGRATALRWGPDSYALAERLLALAPRLRELFLLCAVAATQPGMSLGTLGAEEVLALRGQPDRLRTALERLPLAIPNAERRLRRADLLPGLFFDELAQLWDALLGAHAEPEGLSEAAVERLIAEAEALRQDAQKAAALPALALGEAALRAIEPAAEDALLARCAADEQIGLALAQVDELEKLALFQRWLFSFANNFMSMPDVYVAGRRALFEQGTLVLGGRNFSFSVRVTDRPTHAAVAAESLMYLLYVRVQGATAAQGYEVAVPVTNGTAEGLFVGKRGLFFDRDGVEHDAMVVQILPNPISLREAMFQPFTRIGRMITARFERWAASADAEFEGKLTSSLDQTEATAKAAAAAAEAPPSAPVAPAAAAPPAPEAPASQAQSSLATFTGLTMALAFIGSTGALVFSKVAEMGPLGTLQAVIALLCAVMAPFAILAALKLRRRNVAGLLEAGGWAMNERLLLRRELAPLFTRRPPRPPGSSLRWADEIDPDMVTPVEDEQPGASNPLGCLVLALVALFAVVGFLSSPAGSALRGVLEEAGLPLPDPISDAQPVEP